MENSHNPTRYYYKETSGIYESKIEALMLTNSEKTQVTIRRNLQGEIISAITDNRKAEYKQRQSAVFNFFALGFKDIPAIKFLEVLNEAANHVSKPVSNKQFSFEGCIKL